MRDEALLRADVILIVAQFLFFGKFTKHFFLSFEEAR